MKPWGSTLSMRGKAVCGGGIGGVRGWGAPHGGPVTPWGGHAPPLLRTHHASFRGEDNYLIERHKLLEEALDARALLEAPAGDKLDWGGQGGVTRGG